MSERLTGEQRKKAVGYTRMASAIARSAAFASGLGHIHDDLRCIAFGALSEATLSHDPAKSSFGRHVWQRMTWAVLDAVRSEATRLSLEASLDAAADIVSHGDAGTQAEAIAQIDAATAEIMAAFAASCVASELHLDGQAKLLERETLAEGERAVASLPPEDRCLFELRHRDGLRWVDVVRRLGVSERSARDRCAEIRERLRMVLTERGAGGT